MTEKDKGNQCFKDRQYKEAIKHYENYVQDDHQDNKNAWFNMSLCYSKLNKPKQCIEAATRAKLIDPYYTKCYYRLAFEYQKVKGKEYDVFINAVQFQKLASEGQVEQKKQMQQLAMKYKKHLTMRVNKQEKINNLSQIIDQCEDLSKQNQLEEQVQVDKFLQEWLNQWKEGIQSQDAKWCQIQYIAQSIDYEFGINLAQFYYNQLRSSQLKKKARQNIQQLITRLSKQQVVDLDELGIESFEKRVSKQSIKSDDSDQNLFEDKLQENKPEKDHKQIKNAEVKQQKQVFNCKKIEQIPKKNSQTIQEKLQEKKKKIQQMEDQQSITKQTQKPKIKEKQQEIEPKPEIKSPKVEPQPLPKKKQPKSQQQIENLYNTHCGQLSKSKDLFKQTYKCVLRILEDKTQDSETKGNLLVLLRKRAKKFKLIMESTSQNEQLVVYDLLLRNKMEEYAVDLAPKYYKK